MKEWGQAHPPPGNLHQLNQHRYTSIRHGRLRLPLAPASPGSGRQINAAFQPSTSIHTLSSPNGDNKLLRELLTHS